MSDEGRGDEPVEVGPARVGAADHGPDAVGPAEGARAERRVRTARTVRRAATRAAASALVLGLAAGVAVLDTRVDRAEPADAGAAAVTVPPAASRLVCPGGVRVPTEPEPGDDASYDAQFDPSPEDAVAGLAAVVVGEAEASVAPVGSDDVTDIALVDGAGEATLGSVDGGSVVEVTPEGDVVAAGVVAVVVEAGDLRGVTAASCQRPAADHWLVGGSTAVGSSARLVLQNPGRTAATVVVELWGPAGPVELAGAPQFLVPPGSERVVLLEGVAAEQRRVAVHVSASGGLVGAYVQDSELRGIVPAGVDHVVPGAPPSRRQVVPGVDVPPTVTEGADPSVLRLLAPERSTTARIALVGPEGPVVLPGAEEVRLEAGTVLDVPLGGLPEGGYTVVVDADEPVVAAAMVTRGPSVGRPDASRQDPVERAWAASVAPAGTSAVALPADIPGRLVLGVTEGDGPRVVEADMTLVGADGGVLAEGTVRLTEGRSVMVPYGDLVALVTGTTASGERAGDVAGVVLSTDDPRVAWASVVAVGRATGDMLSVTVPVPEIPSRSEIAVRLR